MENKRKGFIVSLSFIVAIILIAVGFAYIYINNKSADVPMSSTQDLINKNKEKASNSYFTYTNTVGNYSLQLPEGWGVADINSLGEKTSSFQATPSLDKKITAENIEKVDIKRSKIISLMTITPKDATVLKKNYSTFYKLSQIITPELLSPFIKEVRKGYISDGCDGIEYAIRTSKRIYVAQACYPNVSMTNEMEKYLVSITSSLKEF